MRIITDTVSIKEKIYTSALLNPTSSKRSVHGAAAAVKADSQAPHRPAGRRLGYWVGCTADCTDAD